jgi:acyl-CoA thioesterase-1
MLYVYLILLIAACGCSRSHGQPPDEYKPTPAAVAPAPSPAAVDNRPLLVVFGDSISAGYNLPEGQSFPDFLQKKLDAGGYQWRVVNLGISGDTTEGGVARIDSATALKPQIVVLELGGNDGLRGLPLDATRANLDRMVTAFQSAGAKVVLAGMSLPPNYGPDYIHTFEKIYKDLAAKYKLTFIPFLYSDLLTKDFRYIQHDGIHPTADGSEIISGTVLRAVQPLLR